MNQWQLTLKTKIFSKKNPLKLSFKTTLKDSSSTLFLHNMVGYLSIKPQLYCNLSTLFLILPYKKVNSLTEAIKFINEPSTIASDSLINLSAVQVKTPIV